MTPHRWRRIEAVFHSAVEMTPDRRARFLAQACAGDENLRREVDSLLQLHPCAAQFLDGPPRRADLDVPDPEDRAQAETDPRIGCRVGPWRLVQPIARGGMGAVYRAHRDDGAYNAEVAVKLIRPEMTTPGLLRRFAQERRTLAALDHPFITRLLDAGRADDGTPWLVMEFVDGLPIDRYCRERKLSVPARLRLFLDVCSAVQFAHQNLVVHRDLKPANILVTPDGAPKLLDFGIARILSEPDAPPQETLTLPGMRPLTPRYASPEQLIGGPINTATDVYSLGVVLYELLAGTPPYRLAAASPDDARRMICELLPPRPSTVVRRAAETARRPRVDASGETPLVDGHAERPERLHRLLRGDLDTITLKALQKDPARRYASVEQFADDIRRHLDDRPVLARPDTLACRAARLIRRNKLLVGACAAVLVALIGGLLVAGVGWAHARRARTLADTQRRAADLARTQAQDVTAFLQDLLAAANPYELGGDARVTDLLRGAAERIERELAHQPDVAAQVHFALAEVYARIWAWEHVSPHARRALELNRARYGSTDARSADCMVLLGRALTFARDKESVALQREALAVRRKLHGDDHPQVAEAQVCLGFALWQRRDASFRTEAEALYRAGLDTYRRQNRPAPRTQADHARAAFSLAVMLTEQERLDEAEVLHREALDLYRARRDGPDRYMTECMTRYAVLCCRRGDAGEAEALLDEAISRTPHGVGDLHRCHALWMLAAVQQQRGRDAEAEVTFRRALAAECRLLLQRDPPGAARLAHLAQRLEQPDPPLPAESREAFARLHIAVHRGETIGILAAAPLLEKRETNRAQPAPETVAPLQLGHGATRLLRLAEELYDDCRAAARPALAQAGPGA